MTGIASKPIMAQSQTPVIINDIFTPVGSHIQGTDVSSATVISPGALGISPDALGNPLYADKVIMQTGTQNVRYTLDGTTPTTTVGFLLLTTDPPRQIMLTRGVTLTVIEVAGTAALQVQFGT